jgi:hypothetical protein
VNDLTPTDGLHSHGIAIQARSACRTDAIPIARPTCDVGGLYGQLEHITAVPDRVNHLAWLLEKSIETVTAGGGRRGACRTAAFATPPITRASTR